MRPYFIGLGAVGIVTTAILFVGSKLSVADTAMLHLLPILLIAVRFGIWPSITTSMVAAASCNYFFSRPYLGFGFQDFTDVITLVIFVITAMTVNYWAGEAHRQADVLRRSRAVAQLLYRINARLAGLRDPQDILQNVHAELPSDEKMSLALYVARGSVLELAATVGKTWAGSAEESRAAEAAFRSGIAAGRGTGRESESLLRYLPLLADGTVLGVLGIGGARGQSDDLVVELAEEIGRAVGRARRVEEREQASILAEVTKLQSALVSSISHDFRTPLTTIIGAASSLQDDTANFPADIRGELLATIQESGERLHRYVTNLLNTGRLEAGALTLNRDWVDIGDLIESARTRMVPAAEGERIQLSIADGLPLLSVDAALIEQVILNLLDNAVKYSVPGSSISVAAVERAEHVVIEMENVTLSPPPDPSRIFERFHRAPGRSGGGSGLGLSICKGFVEAHGGTIDARCDRGAFRIAVELPKGALAMHADAGMADE